MGTTALAKEIKRLRQEKGWTIKEFIERIMKFCKPDETISPTYITKIEVYGEIPSPKMICKIADVFKHNHKELLDLAKNAYSCEVDR